MNALPTLRRYAMTGTPMQNSFQELYNLMVLMSVKRHGLGSAKEFGAYYVATVQKAQRKGASDNELGLGRQRAADLKQVTWGEREGKRSWERRGGEGGRAGTAKAQGLGGPRSGCSFI